MKKILFGLSVLVIAALLLVGCGTSTGEAVSRGTSEITKGEYFVLPDVNQQLHIYQYMGADAVKQYDKAGGYGSKIALKDVETGDTITLDYVYQAYAGGIKWGAEFKVGLYQAYAGGIDNSRTYYLQFGNPQSAKIDSPLKVCFDSDCKEKKTFIFGTVKI